MQTLRTLRATIERIEGPPVWSEEESEDRDRIMQSCTHLFLANPPHATTMPAIADSLRIKRTRLRWLFSDLDGLLGAILQAHLLDVLEGMEKADLETDGGLAARAAYHASTRTADGEHTPGHALYLRYRHALPPDQLALLAPIVDAITDCASPGHGALALGLLDAPHLTAAEAEHALQSILSTRGHATKAPPRGEAPAPQTLQRTAANPAPATPPPLLNKQPQPASLATLPTSALRKLQAGSGADRLPDNSASRPPNQTKPPNPIFAR